MESKLLFSVHWRWVGNGGRVGTICFPLVFIRARFAFVAAVTLNQCAREGVPVRWSCDCDSRIARRHINKSLSANFLDSSAGHRGGLRWLSSQINYVNRNVQMGLGRKPSCHHPSNLPSTHTPLSSTALCEGQASSYAKDMSRMNRALTAV